MGKTPLGAHGDTGPEWEVALEEDTTDPTVTGAIRNVNGDFRAKDQFGVFNMRPGTPVVVDLDDAVLSRAGTLVYIADGDVVTKL